MKAIVENSTNASRQRLELVLLIRIMKAHSARNPFNNECQVTMSAEIARNLQDIWKRLHP